MHPLPEGIKVFERGWLSSNNVLLQGEQSVLIDSGYVTHAPQTLALVEAALEGAPLDLLINTHLHSDHCGGNAALQQRYDALRIEIPPGDAPAVAAWDTDALSYQATGQQCPRFSFANKLRPGVERLLGGRRWEIHAAPGHDPHAVLLFEPEARMLIAGDALWENGFGVVFPELVGEPSFDEVAATLDLIEKLSPQTAVPGHGKAFDDVACALHRARTRLDGLASSPKKHARHAFKVLLKFKLLESRSLSSPEWINWRDSTPYLEAIRARFFAHQALEVLAEEMILELIYSGAIRRQDGILYND